MEMTMNENSPLALNTEEIVARLVSEFNYPEVGARRVATDLLSVVPSVQAAFLRWWKDGVLDDALNAGGYTLNRLMLEHGMNPIASFLTIDWIIREPRRALASLKRGHDTVE